MSTSTAPDGGHRVASAHATREWVHRAVRLVEVDGNRSADTHLRVLPLPPEWGVQVYLKDESTHPTGSLKHRLARSLFLFGLSNGDIGPDTTLVEASSGSTAVSEAYFARMLGLEFVAVVPRSTASAKLELIRHQGGRVHLVEPGEVYEAAEELGSRPGWHYLDQFAMASTVTDWRGNNNIACSIFEQMALEENPEPDWVVVGAGTGGTSATIGRYCRYTRRRTRLAVADPEGSAFAEAWRTRSREVTAPGSSIEGIGRPRVEPSFVGSVVDAVFTVPDAESVAAMRLLHELTGVRAGASTGTNLAVALRLVDGMRSEGRSGSVVTLICDDGTRYLDTYYDDSWVAARGWDVAAARERLEPLFGVR